jgi:hypothetical protein
MSSLLTILELKCSRIVKSRSETPKIVLRYSTKPTMAGDPAGITWLVFSVAFDRVDAE